ncbi:hypothetical protein ACTQ6A_08970 [Lachnospiraceae bacterium LCP25S3_G4]
MNIGMLCLVIIGGVVGVATTLYLAFSLPAVLIWKLYRKFKYGLSLYD